MFSEEKIKEIKAAGKKWEKQSGKDFARERRKEFHTGSGIPVERCYTPLDLEARKFDFEKDLGFPGQYPYTRGISSIMYRGKLAEITTTAARATPRETNALWKAMTAAGVDFIYFVYDLPSQLGYDPDAPESEGEVGRVGISAFSQRDWEVAFEGIDVGKVNVQQVYNAPALVGIANHLVLAEKQGVDWKNVRGVCQNDILKDYIARGTYIFPPEHGMRLVADALSFCARNVPRYTPLEVNTYQQAEKGADAALEAASGLADAFAYIQYAVDRGVDVDLIAPGINFLTTCEHVDFFEDIAKHRAMRRIYARVMKERFKARKPESMMFRFFAHNAGSNLYRQQYLNNITRGALSALAMVLSGCQTSSLRSYDEAYGIPSPEALTNVLRIQQIVTHETGVTDTIDPLAGSYFLESLTSDLEKKILDELASIDKLGGVVKCIELGYFQRRMMEAAFKWQQAFERGEVERVGVTCYTSQEEEKPIRVYRVDPRVEEQRIADVRELKKRRDNKKVRKTLADIKALAGAPATEENNLMPAVIEAVKAYATVGEICDALRQVWGSYAEPSVI